MQYLLDNECISQTVKMKDYNLIYAFFENRIKTFELCKISLSQNAHALCKAGFYYKGDGYNDLIECFFCGLRIRDLRYYNEPWSTHAYFSPHCTFVLLNKGRRFLNEPFNPNNNTEEFSELFNKLFDFYEDIVLGNTSPDIKERFNSQLSIIDSQGMESMLPVLNNPDNSLSKYINPIPDSLLCKICFDKKMEVLFIPCGHIIACIECAVTFNQCAVCYQPFSIDTYALRVYIDMGENYQTMFSIGTYEPVVNPGIFCKICHKIDKNIAFLPCKHICTCHHCSLEIDICPICSESIDIFLEVYIL